MPDQPWTACKDRGRCSAFLGRQGLVCARNLESTVQVVDDLQVLAQGSVFGLPCPAPSPFFQVCDYLVSSVS